MFLRVVLVGALLGACSDSENSASNSSGGAMGAGGSGGGASSAWSAVEGSFTEVERGTGPCTTPIADVPRSTWSNGDCYRYELDDTGARLQIRAFYCEGGNEISNLGYTLSDDGRMVYQVNGWSTEPPCTVTRLERELVIQGDQIFIVHRTFEAPVADSSGVCPRTAPEDAFSCSGMVVYLVE